VEHVLRFWRRSKSDHYTNHAWTFHYLIIEQSLLNYFELIDHFFVFLCAFVCDCVVLVLNI